MSPYHRISVKIAYKELLYSLYTTGSDTPHLLNRHVVIQSAKPLHVLTTCTVSKTLVRTHPTPQSAKPFVGTHPTVSEALAVDKQVSLFLLIDLNPVVEADNVDTRLLNLALKDVFKATAVQFIVQV